MIWNGTKIFHMNNIEKYSYHKGLGCGTNTIFYLYIPRCASMTIRTFLMEVLKAEQKKVWEMQGEYDALTFIREPLSRSVSIYFKLRERGRTSGYEDIREDFYYLYLHNMKEFCDPHLLSQSGLVEACDEKISLFRLEDGIGNVFGVQVPKLHVSREDEKCELLDFLKKDESTANIIKHTYYKDFQLYESIK